MGHHDKVLWSEGMFLTPQHLQQADRHRDLLLHKRVSGLVRHNWGLGRLRIDRDALGNGEVSVLECQAVMPDGLYVSVPDHDGAPPSRDIASFFGPQTTRLGVYLAIAVARPGDVLVDGEAGGAGSGKTRFRTDFIGVADENGESPDLEIKVARKNLRLLFEGESLDGFERLRIAEVCRDPAGRFELAEDFLPVAYALGASDNMLALVRRLAASLASHEEELSSQRRKGGSKLAGFSPSEAAMFWLLHTINAALPSLWYFEKRTNTHPEALYLELLRLIGGLVTFSGEKVAEVCPEYDHDDQTRTFAELEQTLERLLKVVVPQRSRPIVLRRSGESIHTADEIDAQLLEESGLYLAIRSEVGEDKLIREIPLKAKLSSAARLPALIAAAVRGITLRHLPNPPADVFEPNRTYFQLDKSGDHWSAVVRERSVSIYVPPEFTGAQVEFLAVAP